MSIKNKNKVLERPCKRQCQSGIRPVYIDAK